MSDLNIRLDKFSLAPGVEHCLGQASVTLLLVGDGVVEEDLCLEIRRVPYQICDPVELRF